MQKNDVTTPPTDRGVVNTPQNVSEPIIKGSKALFSEQEKSNKKKSVEMLFDWVQFTIQEQTSLQVLRTLFLIQEHKDCLITESGKFGYNRTYTIANKIHVMENTLRFDMGIHVLLSGSACRELEQLMSWREFFHKVEKFERFKFTRIDIAIDCYQSYFTIATLKRKIKRKELTSKFRTGTFIEQLNLNTAESESASLKFGSMSSDIYVVFYDKLKERNNAGYEVDENITFWVRTELRFKHDLSNQLFSKFVLNDYDLGDYVQQILYNYIDFKQYSKKSNQYRAQTAKFWIRFLCVVKKLKLTNKPLQSSIQKKKTYAEKQFSKTLAMLMVVDNTFYRQLVFRGYEKMKQEDLNIINAHFINENIAPITMNDLSDIFHARRRELSKKYRL